MSGRSSEWINSKVSSLCFEYTPSNEVDNIDIDELSECSLTHKGELLRIAYENGFDEMHQYLMMSDCDIMHKDLGVSVSPKTFVSEEVNVRSVQTCCRACINNHSTNKSDRDPHFASGKEKVHHIGENFSRINNFTSPDRSCDENMLVIHVPEPHLKSMVASAQRESESSVPVLQLHSIHGYNANGQIIPFYFTNEETYAMSTSNNCVVHTAISHFGRRYCKQCLATLAGGICARCLLK